MNMGPVWAWRPLCAALILLVASAQTIHASNPFLADSTAVDADGNIIDLSAEDEDLARIGLTPANVIIDKVVAFPIAGGKDTIVLRNIGGQPADIKGWVLSDDNASNTEFVFEPTEECPQFETIEPAGKLEISASSETNPCGFEFNLSFKDSIKLMDASGEVVQGISWESFDEATALKRVSSGAYTRVPEDAPVLDLLSSLGNFKIFLKAVEVLKLDKLLHAPSDPDYEGPMLPSPPPPPPIIPQFPAHFGFARDRSMITPPPPPPPPPPPVAGIPKRGPYTIIAPTDEAFERLKQTVAGVGEKPLTTDELLSLPEMEPIIKYHIVGGGYSTEYMRNNTPIFTSLGVEFVPFTDPIFTEGAVMLHDSCVDKPTIDVYDCKMQKTFGKCYDPFMISPLSAQWKGGLCERTCERCTCEFGQCAVTQLLDLKAANGIVHTIERVMIPPPIFKKEELAADAAKTSVTSKPRKERKTKPSVVIGFKPKETGKKEGIPTTG